MATISRLSVDLVANSAKFRKDLEKAEKGAKKSMGGIMKSAKAATAAFATLGTAAGSVLLNAAKTYGNFTEALQDVKAKTGATAKELDGLAKSMRNAAKQTRFTATETAQAGTYLAQAGLNVAEINDALRPTLDLAAATKTSVQNTADFMTNIMKGMGMSSDELGRAADVLAVTTAKSNTNLTDLATAMADAAPSARAFGMSIEETASLLGSMANAGIKGSKAGIALRATFASLSTTGSLTEKMLADSTGQMTQQTKALRKLGVHTKDAEGNIRKLTVILKELKEAGGDEQDMIAIFGRRAGSSMMQFMNEGLEGAEALKHKLDNARMAAERMAGVQMDSLNGDITLFKSQFEELENILAENGLNDLFRKMTKSATNFMSAAEPALASMAKYADELAIGLAVVGGSIVVGGIVALTTAVVGLNLALLANPVTWVVGLFVGLAIAVHNNLDEMTFYWKRFAKNVGIFASNIGGGFSTMWQNVMVGFKMMGKGLGIALSALMAGILKTIKFTIDKVIAFYNKVIDGINSLNPFKDIPQIPSVTDGMDKGIKETTEHVVKLKRELAELNASRASFIEKGLDSTEFKAAAVPQENVAGSFDASAGAGFGEGDDPMSKTQTFLESMKLTAEGVTEIFNEMGNKTSSIFTDILTGTTSMADGFKAIGDSILKSVVGAFVQMGVEWVKQQLMMKALEKLGLATTTASTVAAGATMATALAPAAAMMSLATAGGNSVPAMAGMTAAHTLSGTQALLGQFHDGIDNVPQTGSYLIEQGERVVDKRLNKDMTTFLANQNSGGNTTNNSPTLNFNVTGGDADNVEAMLMNHRGKFEGMIRDIYAESAMNSPF